MQFQAGAEAMHRDSQVFSNLCAKVGTVEGSAHIRCSREAAEALPHGSSSTILPMKAAVWFYLREKPHFLAFPHTMRL